MTEPPISTRSIPLGSEAPSYELAVSSTVRPGSYSSPAQFLAKPEDLDELCQLAAQLLEDPLAVQQLSDRVLELLTQDLKRQQERHYGQGRRSAWRV